MSELLHEQQLFAKNIARLIIYLNTKGYEVTFGEAQRTQEQAELYARQGKGSKYSNHIIRLAIDLMLFRGDIYLKSCADYQIAGDFWKSLHSLNRWGGDFKSKDGNHFSMLYQGRA
ncbi:MAG TPA: hypothetical protein DDX29_11980 [Clostridiales bacterium]|nr:hypothetical protein [Clostridiales bacterium]